MLQGELCLLDCQDKDLSMEDLSCSHRRIFSNIPITKASASKPISAKLLEVPFPWKTEPFHQL